MSPAALAAGLFFIPKQITGDKHGALDIILIFAYCYVKQTNKEVAMKITESAREALQELLNKSPGKAVRVVFQGFG